MRGGMATDGRGGGKSAFAAIPAFSRGRLHDEPRSPNRTEFQRDRDRIVHSTAFRRLAHKTQVFVDEEGDHFRTRLTHTIEVAQVARSIARDLRLDEDLAEAVALGHDLGHTPFGHTGEDALADCMAEFGGFDHNSHGFRIVTALERRYAAFDGLNLTAEALEGLVKHNGPLLGADGAPLPGRRVSAAILAHDSVQPLNLGQRASLEAETAAVADDIAYLAHDLDDGLRAGLFGLAELRALPLTGDLLAQVSGAHPGIEDFRLGAEMVRRLITRFIEDVAAEATRRIATLEAGAPREGSAVAFSAAMEEGSRPLRAFLFANMYRHPEVKRVRGQADGVVRKLFAGFTRSPDSMPKEWRRRADIQGAASAAAEYIAGMTDRFALNEHRRLFDGAPPLR